MTFLSTFYFNYSSYLQLILVVFLLTLGQVSQRSNAQSMGDLKNIKVDELSDDQIRGYIQQAEARGLTESQLLALAKQQTYRQLKSPSYSVGLQAWVAQLVQIMVQVRIKIKVIMKGKSFSLMTPWVFSQMKNVRSSPSMKKASLAMPSFKKVK